MVGGLVEKDVLNRRQDIYFNEIEKEKRIGFMQISLQVVGIEVKGNKVIYMI